MEPDSPLVPCFPVCHRVLYLHHFFLCLSIVLSERILHSKFHFYADDLQIYLSGNRSDLDGLIARVNENLEVIHR
jgi:hypothetical protein